MKTSWNNRIPIVYLEGPKSNLSSGEIIRSNFPFFIPTAIDPNALTALSDESLQLGILDINLASFPPQKRSVKWMSDKKNWIIYSLITVNLAIIISMIIVTPIGMYIFYNE